jgi:hypothetical protein
MKSFRAMLIAVTSVLGGSQMGQQQVAWNVWLWINADTPRIQVKIEE